MMIYKFEPLKGLDIVQFGKSYQLLKDELKDFELDPEELDFSEGQEQKLYVVETDLVLGFNNKEKLAFIEYFFEPETEFSIHKDEVVISDLSLAGIRKWITESDSNAYIDSEEMILSPAMGIGVVPGDSEAERPSSVIFFIQNYYNKQ